MAIGTLTNMKNYQIYDAKAGLFQDKPIITSSNSRTALQQYLDNNNINVTFKRSGSNYVRFCITPVKDIDGITYKDGNSVWYEVTLLSKNGLR